MIGCSPKLRRSHTIPKHFIHGHLQRNRASLPISFIAVTKPLRLLAKECGFTRRVLHSCLARRSANSRSDCMQHQFEHPRFPSESLLPDFVVRYLQRRRQQVRRTLDTHLRLCWSADRTDRRRRRREARVQCVHHLGTFSPLFFSIVAQNVLELHKLTQLFVSRHDTADHVSTTWSKIERFRGAPLASGSAYHQHRASRVAANFEMLLRGPDARTTSSASQPELQHICQVC
jgi:hypothetical protein